MAIACANAARRRQPVFRPWQLLALLICLQALLLPGPSPAAAGTCADDATQACEADPLTSTALLTSASLTAGSDIAPFTPLSAHGGQGKLSFSAAPALPPGLMISAQSGEISGRPQMPGQSVHSIMVSDEAGNTQGMELTILIASPTLQQAAQQDLRLAANPPALTPGETAKLSTTGGSGTGRVSFTLISGPCSLDGTTLTATAPGECRLGASKAGDEAWLAAEALPIAIPIRAAEPPPVINPPLGLAASPRFLQAGQTSTLTASGGSGTGAVSFQLESGPCLLKANALMGISAGDCWVSALKGADAMHPVQKSPAILITVAGSVTPSLAAPELPQALDAQLENSASLTATQFGNVGRRLDGLDAARSGFAIDISFVEPATALAWMPPAVAEARKADRLPFGHAAEVNEAARADFTTDAAPALPRPEPRIAGWLNGTITHGGQPSEESFTTSGVTLGADMRITRALTLGAGLGFGESRSGDAISGTDTQMLSGMLYGKWNMGAAGELDMVAGLARGSFDLRRWSAAGSTTLTGTRQARQLFGSIRYGQHFSPAPGFTLTPSLRLEALQLDLATYTESGAPLWALAYGPLSASSISAVPALQAEMSIRHPWGTLSPTGRVELRQALDGRYRQAFAAANFAGPEFAVEQAARFKSALLVGLSLKAATAGGWSADLGYDFTTGLKNSGIASHSFDVTLRKAF